MKVRILAAILALCLCLGACKSQKQNSEVLHFSEECSKICEENAVVLTQQLVMTTFTPANLNNGDVTFPSETDMERFAIASVLFADNTAYRYHDYYTVDEEGYIHLPCKAIQEQVFEVFGIEHTALSSAWKANYNEEADEYTLMSGFGIGNGYECQNVRVQTDSEKSEITVSFDLWTDSNFPDPEKTAECKSRYSVLNDGGSFYLRYLESELNREW